MCNWCSENLVFHLLPILVSWPRGTYALPMPNSGCPITSEFTWSAGYHRQDTEETGPRSSWSSPLHLKGDKTPTQITQHFCVKTTETGGRLWPSGQYCIYRKGTCPGGKVYGFWKRPYMNLSFAIVVHEPWTFFFFRWFSFFPLVFFLCVMWSYFCKITKTVHFDPWPSQERVCKNLHGSDTKYDGDLKSFTDLTANVFIMKIWFDSRTKEGTWILRSDNKNIYNRVTRFKVVFSCVRQDFKKERSNGTTRTRKTTTWLKAFYLTVNTKRILFCSSAVDQMGQRKTLSSCPFASRFSSLSTQAVAR